MRSTMAVACTVLIGLGGCSDSDGSTPEPSATRGGAVMTALEVAQAGFGAEDAGDPDALLALWSTRSTVHEITVPDRRNGDARRPAGTGTPRSRR